MRFNFNFPEGQTLSAEIVQTISSAKKVEDICNTVNFFIFIFGVVTVVCYSIKHKKF